MNKVNIKIPFTMKILYIRINKFLKNYRCIIDLQKIEDTIDNITWFTLCRYYYNNIHIFIG